MISLGKNTARKLAERRNEPHEDQKQHQSRTGNHADPGLRNGQTVNSKERLASWGGQLEVTWWVD